MRPDITRPEAPPDPGAFIRANLPLVAVPTVPEIRLHRANPSSGLRKLADADRDGFGAPYWAYPWPGGIVLARHVLDHPEALKGRKILDLGAGSGLVAIAAAKAGAAAVTAADIDPYAAHALRLNAAANDVAVSIRIDDVARGPVPPVDLVLVGDLFYAAALAAQVTAFLERCAAAGLGVLVGDIGRDHLPRDRLREIAAYPTAEVGEAGTKRTASVFDFLGFVTTDKIRPPVRRARPARPSPAA